ncbi:uncharacterized protein LOC105690602 isoform X2 [Athalia rosae]|uniref:uncharacterized protein LOC105690602 isoform X2 n=1 Tax=Athalia rosae TaxID=37344 RepID=UPI002033292D|nr:uncharacterized protein LOC105690602 isoform X2 [Athalia rosae]
MPSMLKQRRVNKARKLVKKSQRFGGNSRVKLFNPLCGKLKSNNISLAKALSMQKQENQLLFKENIRLTSQLQSANIACNKRDLGFGHIQNNAKEMLTMLVTMTNYVTNTIMRCQEFSGSSKTAIQHSPASVTKKESMKRLSMKSPTKAMVKPMVSGHTITKPTINLRRVNMQKLNNFTNLSVVEEASPDRVLNSTLNSNLPRVSTVSTFLNTKRTKYDGERRRRLPERIIPVEYIGADEEDGEILSRPELRLSGRFSDKLSGRTKKCSEKSPISKTRIPSVTLCDVSKILHNLQTINIGMLQDCQNNEELTTRPNVLRDSRQQINEEDSWHLDTTAREGQESDGPSAKKLQVCAANTVGLREKKIENMSLTNNHSGIYDPLEGPSWLLGNSEVSPTIRETLSTKQSVNVWKGHVIAGEDRKSDICRKKRNVRKLDSSDSEPEAENKLGKCFDDDSMEFTECINGLRAPEIASSRVADNQKHIGPHVSNLAEENSNRNSITNTEMTYESSNLSEDIDESYRHITINRSTEFVTDRRMRFDTDDEDEDTLMLRCLRPVQPSSFNINEFRLPVVNGLVTELPEEPHNLIDDRLSNNCSVQLPKFEDSPKTAQIKHTVKQKQKKKRTITSKTDSSDSDCSPKFKSKSVKLSRAKKLKDPSSAKVVLQKLDDVHPNTNPNRSKQNGTHDTNTSQKMSSIHNSEPVTDSNNSTCSVSEPYRPKRVKAPVNLKEPPLGSIIFNLRRNYLISMICSLKSMRSMSDDSTATPAIETSASFLVSIPLITSCNPSRNQDFELLSGTITYSVLLK